MNLQENSSKPPVALVFWIIWFAILNGLVMIQFIVGGGIPKGPDQGNPPLVFVVLAGILALAALAIRYTWIPKIKMISQRLTAMVVGLALSEGIGLIGIFAVGQDFPATQKLLLLVAFGCIVNFAPVYAKERKENGRLS